MSYSDLLDLLNQQGLNPKRVASTNGGEYHSQCPYCNDKDDFICWPNEQRTHCTGSYYCRQCGRWGDTIQFRKDFNGESFKEIMNSIGNASPNKNCSHIPKIKSQPVSLEIPRPEWRNEALLFTKKAYEQIFKHPSIISYLEKRGITLECIKRFMIGYCSEDCYFDRQSWGLGPELNENGNPKKIWIPKGIIIPTCDSDGTVLKLKIRREDWIKGNGSKYVNVSQNTKIFSCYGDRNKDVMVVVESELDAITIVFYAGEFCFAVAAGSNITNPDPMTSYFADKIQHLLICHDNDDPGRKMRDKWLGQYPKAQPCPTPKGKDIGEAYVQGLNIRDHILNNLPSEYRYKYSICSNIIESVDVQSNTLDVDTVISGTSTQEFLMDKVEQEPEHVVISPITETEKQNPISEDDFSIEDLQLFDWFLNEKELPSDPFKLNAWMYVVDTTKYYESLKTSIACGYRNVRVKTGVLQDEIRRLQDYVNINKNHKTA